MIEYILLVLGFILLVKGADFLIDGSSALAKKLKVPSLVIGLTIVAFGTSLPEFVVNVFSSIKGNTDIALGNIIGSNIANILLILGIASIIRPLRVKHSTIWKEIPYSLLAALILLVLANFKIIDNIGVNALTRVSGIIMLFFFILFLYYVIQLAKNNNHIHENKKEYMEIEKMGNKGIATLVLGGLLALYIGGEWVVQGAIAIARGWGISEYLISATIVAIGTSLPELFTSVIAAMRKEDDIAIGDIVGSNVFNILMILAISAIITPIYLPAFINFDIIFLIAATVLLFLFMFTGKKHTLQRYQGFAFLLLYGVYLYTVIIRG